MSFGNAVIALDTVFNREVLQDGKFGLFFNKDENSVKELIVYADDNEKEILALKNNSKQALEKKYEWDHIIDQYIEVFKEVTN